MFYQI